MDRNLDGNLKPNKMFCYLILSYFDQVVGPRIFYCPALDNFDDLKEISTLLDLVNKEGTFAYSESDYQTLNHIFYLF